MVGPYHFNIYTWNMALLCASNDVLIKAGETKVFVGKIPFRNLVNTDFQVFQKKRDLYYGISMKGVYPSIKAWNMDDDDDDVRLTNGDRTLFEIVGCPIELKYPLDFFEGDKSPFNIPEDFRPSADDDLFPWVDVFLNLPARKRDITLDVKLAFLHHIDPVSHEFCKSYFGIKTREELKEMGINADLLDDLKVTEKIDENGKPYNLIHF